MIMFKEADRFSKKKGIIYLKRGWFNQEEMIPFYVLFWGLCSFLSIEYIYANVYTYFLNSDYLNIFSTELQVWLCLKKLIDLARRKGLYI